jgi:hypothetical protein
LGKKLSAKFTLDPEQSSLEDALRRLKKADAQRESAHAQTWLIEEGRAKALLFLHHLNSHKDFLSCR